MSSATKIIRGLKIPLRDGIQLSATLYTPPGESAAQPCLLMLTPYIADSHHERAMYFADRGWPFLVVDVRGRGNSEGTFRPGIQEAKDGYDVVEWLAQQPYCNGKVGMSGGSYAGYAQWATAKESPPHLATIIPTASPFYGVDVPFRNNISFPYNVQWLTLTDGRTPQAKIAADRRYWSGVFRDWYKSGQPFRDVATFAENRFAVFQEWVSHPCQDAHWDSFNPTAEQYAQLQIPVLTITGSYDDDQPGALEHYRQHVRSFPTGSSPLHYLVIGPWDHLRTGWMPCSQFGGLSFSPESAIDLPALFLEWYRWVLQEGPKPKFLRKPVAYYVMGAEQWRYADTLEQITARWEPLFLASEANANDVFASGSLVGNPRNGHPDCYTYDPCQCDGPEIDAEALADPSSLVDQTLLYALGGRILVYHSAPFAEDCEVSGCFRLDAWVAIDCPDTDIYVSIYEIDLSGGSIRLSTDAIRARYRESLRVSTLVDTQEPLKYVFNRFTFVSRTVKRGHRLRLVIAPMGRLIEATFAEKNYNGGGVVAEEGAKNGRAVTVKLFHGLEYPSVLCMPVGQSEPGK